MPLKTKITKKPKTISSIVYSWYRPLMKEIVWEHDGGGSGSGSDGDNNYLVILMATKTSCQF